METVWLLLDSRGMGGIESHVAELAAGLRVLGYEDGFLAEPSRYLQRLCAVRETASSGVAPRYPL